MKNKQFNNKISCGEWHISLNLNLMINLIRPELIFELTHYSHSHRTPVKHYLTQNVMTSSHVEARSYEVKAPFRDKPACVWSVLTLESRCSRLWSEAHFLWSSESSSTWLSRLKCSLASFSCISRTCSSCSNEQTFPGSQRWLYILAKSFHLEKTKTKKATV